MPDILLLAEEMQDNQTAMCNLGDRTVPCGNPDMTRAL